jgi:hypothetical protein
MMQTFIFALNRTPTRRRADPETGTSGKLLHEAARCERPGAAKPMDGTETIGPSPA